MGLRERNWIGVEAFLRRGEGTPTKTADVGEIIRDLLRLCPLPEELTRRSRQNERYLLLVFDGPASAYLALTGRDHKRAWLSGLLSEGRTDLTVDLPKSLTP